MNNISSVGRNKNVSPFQHNNNNNNNIQVNNSSNTKRTQSKSPYGIERNSLIGPVLIDKHSLSPCLSNVSPELKLIHNRPKTKSRIKTRIKSMSKEFRDKILQTQTSHFNRPVVQMKKLNDKNFSINYLIRQTHNQKENG
jgi:hypothetical protein